MIVAVASTNPVKLQAARQGFERMFPGECFDMLPVSAESGVSSQPRSSAETRRGALNRARAAQQLAAQADYWVGIEGGVEEENGHMAAFAWIAVLSPKTSGLSRTGSFFLPDAVARLVRQGLELGEADDRVFGRTNSKQENGAVGLLTGDVLDRAGLYRQAVILALIPFKNPDLYA